MSKNIGSIQKIRGMNDILPEETPLWQHLEEKCRLISTQYGYNEIRFPLIEKSLLFSRTVGQQTDIVSKEMYSFEDLNGDQLSLRPEGTAGCTRASIENNLIYNTTQRLWYLGPMFRHERPQKGRYRQFYQFGVEVFGIKNPAIDAELILLGNRLWQALGLGDKVRLELNSLGSIETREKYRQALVQYLSSHMGSLDEDSLQRLKSNPLRILDSKDPQIKEIIKNAPKLNEYLDAASQKHFDQLRTMLDKMKIRYTINPYLVRGLDYYTDTVFEWMSDQLGAQGTVCAGGRYDDLVELLGGEKTAAVGFAAGLERLILLLKDQKSPAIHLGLFIITTTESLFEEGLTLAEKLHSKIPELTIHNNLSSSKLKRQFKQADKSGARFALVLGEEEMKADKITMKDLRQERPQMRLSFNELIEFLKNN